MELCQYDPLGDNTGEQVAVKRLQPNRQANLDDFRREIQTISSLHSDYIVKYRGVCKAMGKEMQPCSLTSAQLLTRSH